MTTYVSIPLTIAAIESTNGTVQAGNHTPVDATSGPLTMTLPTPAHVGARLRVEKIDSTTHTVTVSGTLRGASATVVLYSQYQGIDLEAESLTSWRPCSSLREDSVGGVGINFIVQLTAAAYAALGTKDPATLYVIVG